MPENRHLSAGQQTGLSTVAVSRISISAGLYRAVVIHNDTLTRACRAVGVFAMGVAVDLMVSEIVLGAIFNNIAICANPFFIDDIARQTRVSHDSRGHT